MLSTADWVPVVEGVNATLMAQLAPAGNVAGAIGQLLLCAKFELFDPVMIIPLMDKGAVPVFLSVTV